MTGRNEGSEKLGLSIDGKSSPGGGTAIKSVRPLVVGDDESSSDSSEPVAKSSLIASTDSQDAEAKRAVLREIEVARHLHISLHFLAFTHSSILSSCDVNVWFTHSSEDLLASHYPQFPYVRIHYT